MSCLDVFSGIATTDNELTKQCGYLREADNCLRNFTRRCTTPLQRELINFISEGSTRLLHEYCTSGTQLRNHYLKLAPCLNRAKQNQRLCVKDLQAALEAIGNVEWDKRIPAGCCAYRRFQRCAENLVESKCGKDAVEFMNLLLRMALSRLPDIICQGIQTTIFYDSFVTISSLNDVVEVHLKESAKMCA